MPQLGLPYSGNELWEIQDNAQPQGFQTFLKDFGDQATRIAVLGQPDYTDANNDGVNIIAFVSRESVKALMGGVAGNTARTNVVGVVLLFGYDAVAETIVLVARSANGYLGRPAGSEFTNFNYLSKTPSDTNSNPGLTDAESDDLTAAFRANGYDFLTGLANDAALSVKFDNHVLARLLYSDIGPTPTITGQTEFHLVVAPPWDGEMDLYLTVVGKGKKANNDPVHHTLPPCPRYCD